MAAKQTPYIKKIQAEVKKTPEEYLPTLLEIVHAFREGVSLKSADASFRQGWKEVLAEETKPVSDLWDDVMLLSFQD